jgi:16S rRNA (guanine527-N7)-methyltransferase
LIRSVFEKGAIDLGLAISESDIESLELFAVELIKWNRRINLTAIRAEEEIAVKHFLDSRMLAEQLESAESLLDIGSGAGMPSIPVKIFKPELKVVSVDAVGKKILFQKHVARLLKLEGFEAIHNRAENLCSSYAGRFDVITSRAFSSLERFVEIAHPLMSEGGRMIAMKGPAASAEVKSIDGAIRNLGYGFVSQHTYCLPCGMGERSLICISACNGL